MRTLPRSQRDMTSTVSSSPRQSSRRTRLGVVAASLPLGVTWLTLASPLAHAADIGLLPAIPLASPRQAPVIDETSRTDFYLESATVARLTVGDVLALPTATGDAVRMRVQSVGVGSSGARLVRFVGDADLLSVPFANATIVLRDGLVGGFVRPRDGFEIALVALGPGHQAIRAKAESLGDCCGVVDAGVVLPPDEGGVATGCQDSVKIVDVAYLVTPNAANFWGGVPQITLLIEAAVDDANLTFKNSGILTRLKLVHIEVTPANFDSAAFQSGTLPQVLTGMTTGAGGFVAPLWYALAHDVRDMYGADLCQAVMDATSATLCGLSDIFDGDPERAYSVVETSCLGDYVPAHELGHGFGACHAIGDGGGCDGGGYYPFSNGWRFTGQSGQLWRTVMAYAPGTRIPFFSTPGTEFDSKPVGVAGNGLAAADNARTIGLTASSVANFRCTVDPPVDCNNNGEPDAIDILDGTSEDCNGNAIPDECDIASGFLTDVNNNGIPDQCEVGASKITSPEVPGQPVILDVFGYSLSVGHRLDQVVDSSAYLVAGAYGDDEAASNSGAAYIVDLVGSTPDTITKLKAADAATNANAQFGRAVAGFKRVDQTTPPATARSFAAIGAFRAPNAAAADQGATYIFAQSGATPWAQTLKLKAADGQANDWFGFSTAMTRIGADNFETLVVGAPRASVDKGAVYVYRYQLTDTTLLSKKLVIPLAGAGDQFGWSVAVDNNTGDRAVLIAGAPGYSANVGRVRAFERTLGANVNFASNGPTIALGPTEALPNDRFGEAVAIDDNVAIIGAPGKDGGRGAAYYFERVGANAWVQRQKIVLPVAAINDRFGSAVSLLRRSDGALILIVSAPKGDAVTPSGPQTNLGVIGYFKYKSTSNSFVTLGVGVTVDGQTGDEAGTSLAQIQTAAGTSSLSVLGVPFDDDAGLNSGSVWLTPITVPLTP